MDRKNCVCYLKQGPGLYSENRLSSKENVLSAMGRMMIDLDREMCCVIHLDKSMVPISFNICSIGTINSSLVTARESFKAAVLDGASYVLLLHNHPSGDPTPSQADVSLTKGLVEAGRLLGIPIVDHVVIGRLDGEPSFASVRADYDRLWEMPELPDASPALKEVSVRIKLEDGPLLYGKTPQMAALDVLPQVGGCGKEQVVVAGFDTKNRLIREFRIPKERAMYVQTTRRIIREAVVNNAAYLLLFTGEFPRLPDKKLVDAWTEAGRVMQLPLMDAIAVGGGDYVSAREQGRMPGGAIHQNLVMAEK